MFCFLTKRATYFVRLFLKAKRPSAASPIVRAAIVAGSGVTSLMVVRAWAVSEQLIIAPEVAVNRNWYVPSFESVYGGLVTVLPLWTVPVQFAVRL